MRQPPARARALTPLVLLALVITMAPGLAAGARAAGPQGDATHVSSPALAAVAGPGTASDGAGTAPAARQKRLADSRPDIVMLMVDDLAEMDLRVWERLPTIRRLFLEQGVRFTEYIGNNPLCCPGRANVLTGQWSVHHGVIRNDARLLDPSTTIATELAQTGYWTAIVGKYLNLTHRLADKTPPGWDHALIYNGGYRPQWYWTDGVLHRDGSSADAYMTDIIADQAVAWIDEAPPDDPLFLFLTPYGPHASGLKGVKGSNYFPLPAPRHLQDPRCKGIAPWNPPGYDEAVVTDKPAYIRRLPRLPWANGWPLRTTCESLLSVDEMLGRVVDELETQGRTNVLFVLTGDNGMTFGAHRWTEKKVPYAAPLPLFMHWSSRLGDTPRTIDGLATNVDLAPTLCAVAGCTMGPYANGHGTDGMSLLPLLDGSKDDLDRAGVRIEDLSPSLLKPATFRGVWTSRTWTHGRWLYVQYSSGERELYPLETDPWMLRNQAGKPRWATVERDLRTLLRTLKP